MVAASLLLFYNFTSAQTNRVRFRYRISHEKEREMNANGLYFTAGTDSFSLCPHTSKFKTLITLVNGQLVLDPWSILDHRTDTTLSQDKVDPCYAQPRIINALTSNTIIVDLRRSRVGEPTKVLRLPYQTWIFTVNSIGVKFRPKVTAANDSIVFASAMAGVSLGFSAGYSLGFTTFTHRTANSWSFTPSVGLGFSTVSLSKEPLTEKVDLKGVGSNFVLSPAFNFVVARNDIGLIFAYGTDLALGKYGNKWAYHRKPFLGIGVAAGFKL